MDIVIAFLLFAGTVLGGMAVNMIASEFYDLAPSLAHRIIEHAVKRLPVQMRERQYEEWLADNNDFPGKLGKLLHAIGCCFGAWAIAQERRKLSAEKAIGKRKFSHNVMRARQKVQHKWFLTLGVVAMTSLSTFYLYQSGSQNAGRSGYDYGFDSLITKKFDRWSEPFDYGGRGYSEFLDLGGGGWQ